jgi:hypothetical protein
MSAKSQRWKTVVGTVLILGPVLVLLLAAVTGVFLGSLGMDIHWNGPMSLLYLALVSLVIALCGSVVVGFGLRRGSVVR